MKAKSWTMLLPVSMCFFPGLLVSQDTNGRIPFYEKEFGATERNSRGTEDRSKNAPGNKNGSAKSSQADKIANQDEARPAGTPPSSTRAPAVPSAGNESLKLTSKELLRAKLERLNQQYQEELQTLLGSAQEPNGPIVNVSGRQGGEAQRAQSAVPRPLDPGFVAEDWPTLKRPQGELPWESRKIPGNPSRSSQSDRGIVTAAGQAQSGQLGDEGDAYRSGGAREAIIPVQGVYPGPGGNPAQYGQGGNPAQYGAANQGTMPRQTIKTPPPSLNYNDPNQAQPATSRRGNAPVQPMAPTTGRPRPVISAAVPETDLHARDLETLKLRYLEDLRALNRRYQEEASHIVSGIAPTSGQAVQHHPEMATAQATNPRSAPYATVSVQKSGRYFDFFWLPRMFGYFKPTLPFARMNQETVVVDQTGAGVRTSAQANQPVKQTVLFSGPSQTEPKRTAGSRAPGRPVQGAPASQTKNDSVQPVAAAFDDGGTARGAARNVGANGYRNPAYRDAAEGAMPREQDNRPAPRMLPVHNRQGENAENEVRSANAPGPARAGNEPERMPKGTMLPASESERLQHAIDQLHRKYQEDLKALLSPPSAPQELEDQVSYPRQRQDQGNGSVRGYGNDSPEPEYAHKEGSAGQTEPARRRSAEEFFELIQANSQTTPPWARSDAPKKSGAKDGVAQTRFDSPATIERGKGNAGPVNRPARDLPGNSSGAPSEGTERGGR